MKIMWTAFTAARSALSAPTQASTRVLDTHRQVGSVSCGITAPFSWVLVCTGFFFFVPSRSPFLQSCASYGGSIVGLMATASKEAYATPESTAVACHRGGALRAADLGAAHL